MTPTITKKAHNKADLDHSPNAVDTQEETTRKTNFDLMEFSDSMKESAQRLKSFENINKLNSNVSLVGYSDCIQS